MDALFLGILQFSLFLRITLWCRLKPNKNVKYQGEEVNHLCWRDSGPYSEQVCYNPKSALQKEKKEEEERMQRAVTYQLLLKSQQLHAHYKRNLQPIYKQTTQTSLIFLK